MTTVQTMLSRAACTGLLALGASCFSGCNTSRETPLEPPEVLVTPYDSRSGEVLWAVAPLANESGVSFADTGAVADALVSKIDEVRGIACLPLNRTIAAMRARGLSAIRSPADARAVANTLGVDGLIVGSVTAYDPYNPPKLGMKLALFSRESDGGPMAFDPIKLQASYSDYNPRQQSMYESRPVATLSEHLDGANHEVQMELRRYSVGRHEPDSALGWKKLLASMDLYTEFAAQVGVSRLLEQERLRFSQPTAGAPQRE
jgi:hypothetical protein